MMFIDINCVYIDFVFVFDFFRDLSDGCCKSKNKKNKIFVIYYITYTSGYDYVIIIT